MMSVTVGGCGSLTKLLIVLATSFNSRWLPTSHTPICPRMVLSSPRISWQSAQRKFCSGAEDKFPASRPRDAAALFAQEIPGFRDDEDHALFVLVDPLKRIRQEQLLYALLIRAKVNDVHAAAQIKPLRARNHAQFRHDFLEIGVHADVHIVRALAEPWFRFCRRRVRVNPKLPLNATPDCFEGFRSLAQ